MRKQFSLITLVLVCSLLPTVLAAQDVVAYSEIGIGLNPTEITTCPDRVLTSEEIEIEVQNLADNTRTFDVEITDNCKEGNGCSPFNKYQFENLVLMSGEKAILDTIFIHLPYGMDPGTYELKITVTDVSTLEKETRTLDLNVLECYSVDLTTDENTESVCSDDAEKTYYNFSVKNKGKDKETFKLSASKTWATFRDAQTNEFLTNLELDAGETREFELVLDAPELATGLYEITVFVDSATSYAKDSEKFFLEVDDCYDFNVNLNPTEGTSCTGRSAEFMLTIENTGQTEDTFLVNTPAWIEVQENEVTLIPGETREIQLSVIPAQEGRTEFQIIVNSATDPDATQILTGYVTSEACKGAVIEIEPKEDSVCGGETTTYTVRVENLGTETDNFVLEADVGTLEHELITIGSMETKLIELVVDTTGLEGLNTITVKITSEGVEKIATTDLNVEDCFGALLQIQPETDTLCACSESNYTITVTNTGEADNFTLNFEGFVKSFYLEKNEVETLEIDYTLDCDMDGTYLLTATLTSEGGISEEKHVSINARARDSCYGVEFTILEGSDAIEITDCGKGIVLLLKNMGEFTNDYLVGIKGPDWMYVEPVDVTLKASEEANIYVYVAPLYGTGAGAYTATVEIDSFNVHKEIPLTIDLLTDYLPGNETDFTTGESSIEINTSFGDGITGEVVGNETVSETEIPMWKTLTIGIITLIIILVLVARFVLLMRK